MERGGVVSFKCCVGFFRGMCGFCFLVIVKRMKYLVLYYFEFFSIIYFFLFLFVVVGRVGLYF